MLPSAARERQGNTAKCRSVNSANVRRFLSFLLVVCIWVYPVDGAEQQQGGSTDNAQLPDAPEKALIMQYCTACHGIERVLHSGGDDARWKDRVQRMVRWGARIPQEHIEAASLYLAKALPLRPRPPASLSYFANTAVREVAVQSIQSTLRLAASGTHDRQLLIHVPPDAAPMLKIGQRARVFSVESRAVMIPATIIQLIQHDTYCEAIARVAKPVSDTATAYLVEVVVEHGRFLAIPNEAIIEEERQQRVYVQDAAGEYLPRTVQLGMQGDQLTQVLAGLSSGERVVALGSFFIDAEYKLNFAD